MAVSPPTVKVGAAFVTASPQVSSSHSLTAGDLLIVVAGATGASAATGTLNTGSIASTHTGLSAWELYQQSNPGVTSATALYVFVARASSATTGTVTVTYSNATPAKAGFAVIVVPTGYDTADLTDGFVSAAGTAASLSLVLTDTPTADDLVLGFICSRNDTDGMTPDADMTELLDSASATPSPSLQVQYDTGTTSTDVSWSGVGTIHWSALAFIVRNAGGGPPPTGTFYEWDGTNKDPITLLGVWNGTTIDPVTFREIST